MGVFANTFIADGQMIGRYEGIMRSNRTYTWASEAGLTSGAYAFQLTSGAWVDGEDPCRSSWTRYINHAAADAANIAPYGRGRPFIFFEAIRDIEEGEELVFDYVRTCQHASESLQDRAAASSRPPLPRPVATLRTVLTCFNAAFVCSHMQGDQYDYSASGFSRGGETAS